MTARVPPSSSTASYGSGSGADCKLAPGLYLVATPIGNRRDISLRALDVLAAASLILCEDTRVTRTLCQTYGWRGRLLSCHEHNQMERLDTIRQEVAAAQVVALVSDAGLPVISDPGAPLVKAAQTAGIPVTVIPGANAALTALCLSGLPAERFCFGGFLPPRRAARRQELAALAGIPATLIFYESPGRLTGLLADVSEVMPERAVAVARELTKLHEEVRNGSARELLEHYEQHAPRGEVVVLLGPPGATAVWSDAEIDRRLQQEMANHSLRDAAAVVAAHSGRARREVYARGLSLQRERER